MSNTTTSNPLARLVLEAQQIIAAATLPGANTALAVQCLAGLLCTPVAHEVLLDTFGAEAMRAAAAATPV
ncbi:hypothetical protein [Massilia phyllosphaerae]|uniref:hypothetical protein n=1 Tax=Massilia phyllosphaerae TaxID=3106034 RepID=UPI002B1CD6DC|nr:hypothetical protein [Massilia sp. SGZ-792]